MSSNSEANTFDFDSPRPTITLKHWTLKQTIAEIKFPNDWVYSGHTLILYSCFWKEFTHYALQLSAKFENSSKSIWYTVCVVMLNNSLYCRYFYIIVSVLSIYWKYLFWKKQKPNESKHIIYSLSFSVSFNTIFKCHAN